MSKRKTKLLSFLLKKLKGVLILFLIVFGVFIVGLFWIISKSNSLNNEIDNLESQSKSVDTSVNANSLSVIDEKSELIADFMPDSFDVWQMLKLIEAIANRTKFNIDSYNLNEEKALSNVLQTYTLQVNGSGTLAEFLEFIKEYKYITGQIVTVDSVNLSGNEDVLTRLSVNTYAFKPEVDLSKDGLIELDKVDRNILNKLTKYQYKKQKQAINDDYESAINPFE